MMATLSKRDELPVDLTPNARAQAASFLREKTLALPAGGHGELAGKALRTICEQQQLFQSWTSCFCGLFPNLCMINKCLLSSCMSKQPRGGGGGGVALLFFAFQELCKQTQVSGSHVLLVW